MKNSALKLIERIVKNKYQMEISPKRKEAENPKMNKKKL